MVNVSQESIFPADRTKLWKVLESHFNDNVIGKIHPFIISSKRINKEEDLNALVFERTIRNFGRTFGATTKYQIAPMEMFRWEVTASTGGVAPGGWIENKYSDAGEGKTKVVTNGKLDLRGVPGFLQGWLVRRTLGQWDDQDLRYLSMTQT